MKYVHRYIPELAFLRLRKCLELDTPLFKYELGGFYFILDLFHRLPAFNTEIKYTEDGLIRISSKYFKKFITNGYSKYLEYLIRHKIVHCDKIKKVDKAYGYSLEPELNSKIIQVKIPSGTIIHKRIIENSNKRKKCHRKLDDHVKIMKAHFKKTVKVNLDAALKWLDSEIENKTINLNQYNVFLLSLYAIEDGELFFNVNNTNGRIDSNITNLKSELRQFVIGGYQHIDCQNSQPLITNLLTDYILDNSNSKFHCISSSQPTLPSLGDDKYKILSKELSNRELDYLKFFPKMNEKVLSEFIQFRKDTFDKDFYQTLQARYEEMYGKPILRKDVKDIVYKVFFSKNPCYLEEKRVFKKMYPNVYRMIYNLKKEKHNRFALCLQRAESELFIQRICKALVEAGIVPLTIHDSIIVCAEDTSKALEIMKSEYMKLFSQTPNFICKEL